MCMRVNLLTISFSLLLIAPYETQAQTPAITRHGVEANMKQSAALPFAARPPRSASAQSPLSNRLKKCNSPLLSRLMFAYGGIFAADTGKVRLPSNCFFRNEAEVRDFQRRAGVSSEVVGGVRIELQPDALRAFLAARAAARKEGLNITPRGANSARRSYADTVELWSNRVAAAITYWTRRGKLTKTQAERLRALSPDKQVAEVLALEERRIYFGNGFANTILQSVAAPGSSQHIMMLALDIDQYSDTRVRAILAKYGWHRTVKNDAPHFTYLGVAESTLPSLGLRREASDGGAFWVPIIKANSANPPAAGTTGGGGGKAGGKGDTTGDKPGATTAGNNFRATLSPHVVIVKAQKPLLSKLARLYFESSGELLHITSGYRTPEEQAKAMYNNIVAYGPARVVGTYGGSAAAIEIVDAYRQYSKSREKALAAMTKTIRGQVSRGVYISLHLVGRAFDIRLSSARIAILTKVVQSMGGQVVVEDNHYHAEF